MRINIKGAPSAVTGFTAPKPEDMLATLQRGPICWNCDDFLPQIIDTRESSLRFEIDHHEGNGNDSRQRAKYKSNQL